MRRICLVLFTLVLSISLFSQWSSSPVDNNPICVDDMHQRITKIAPTNNGGCYIGWLEGTPDGSQWSVYLQLLDQDGNNQWPDTGLLISDNSYPDWTQDWDIAVDEQNNCVLTFCDQRNGNLDAFAYLVSPGQQFLWGQDGIPLCESLYSESNPQVAATSDECFVFSWQSGDYLKLQKINLSGEKQWSDDGIELEPEVDHSFVSIDLISAGNNESIVYYGEKWGTYPSIHAQLYLNKIDSNGNLLWGQDGVMPLTNREIPHWYMDDAPIISDYSGGALVAWVNHNVNNQNMSCWVQHINSEGERLFADEGAEAADNVSTVHTDPVIAYDPVTLSAYVFWVEKSPNHTLQGVSAQRLSDNGQRLWGEAGIEILEPSFIVSEVIGTYIMDMNPAVFFTYEEDHAEIEYIYAYALDQNSAPAWCDDYVEVCASSGQRDRQKSCQLSDGSVVVEWEDSRSNTSYDIYGQNVNENGWLGINAPDIEIISPEEDAHIEDFPFDIVFSVDNFDVAQSGGDGYVNVSFGTNTIEHYSEEPITINEVPPGDYRIILELVDESGSAFTPPVKDYIDVNLGNGVNYNNTIMKNTFSLSNHPNPFNPNTVIEFSLNESSMVNLSIYNVQGQRVKTLVNKEMNSGVHTVAWDGKDSAGDDVSSGIYFYKLESGDRVDMRKMLLLK